MPKLGGRKVERIAFSKPGIVISGHGCSVG